MVDHLIEDSLFSFQEQWYPQNVLKTTAFMEMKAV